jgi:hypothetical protein
MNDQDIRTVLKAELMRRYAKDNNTLVLDEVGIRHGAARIDLVVVNHQLHGYEIKSDRDSLKRLPDQIRAYSSIMDRVTLVVGYRHAYEALKMVPEWWGVRLAETKKQSGTVVLSGARPARNNPKVDLDAAVALLWRGEALAILEEMGAAGGVRSKRRSEIYKRLVELSDPDLLRSRIRQQLKQRRCWRVGVQQRSCGD